MIANGVDHRRSGPRILQIERQLEGAPAGVEHLGERRDVRREACPIDLGDGPLAEPLLDDPVVIEHRDAVSGQPDVALEAGRAQPEREVERLDRVLGRVGTSAAVGERDRWIEQ